MLGNPTGAIQPGQSNRGKLTNQSGVIVSQFRILLNLIFLIAFLSVANFEARTAAQIFEPTIRNIEEPRIFIAVERDDALGGRSLNARVRINCRVQGGDQHDPKCVFPVPKLSFEDVNFKVLIDGQPVDSVHQVLESSSADLSNQPNDKQFAEWEKKIEGWIESDPRLHELVQRYRKLNSTHRERAAAQEELENLITHHLIRDDLKYVAIYVASGDTLLDYLVRLMPEIDPSLRIDVSDANRKYVSLLNLYNSSTYQPYAEQWRAAVDQWFASKPDLAPVVARLRLAASSMRDADKILQNDILKHVHDANGLSLPIALDFIDFLQTQSFNSGIVTPHSTVRFSQGITTELARDLFPEIRDSLDQQTNAITGSMADWGYDMKSVSVITGELFSLHDAGRPAARTKHDPTIDRTLGMPTSSRVEYDRMQFSPGYITFSLPLESEQTADVSIEYILPIASLRNCWSSQGDMFPAELIVPFPVLLDAPMTIEVPALLQPVIWPAPDSIRLNDDGSRVFQGGLSKDQSTIHLRMVDFFVDEGAFGSHLDVKRENQGIIQSLIAKNKNSTTKPMLEMSLFKIFEDRDLWTAHELESKIEKEHPDFYSCFLRSKDKYKTEAIQILTDWLDAKSKSPIFQTDEDFARIGDDSYRRISPTGLLELATRLNSSDTSLLTTEEKFGRLFVLCEAGIDRDKNLAEFLELLKQNSAASYNALKLIRHLTIDKTVLLPYVIKLGRNAKDQMELGVVARTLQSFKKPESAPLLIEFISSTDETLLIQSSVSGLSRMKLPDLLDSIIAIDEKVNASSESAFLDFVRLLLNSDRERAIPVLETMIDKFPRRAAGINRELAYAGYMAILKNAINDYHESDDIEDTVSAAVTAISELASADDIANLNYRNGLPQWMNGKLISVIRAGGSDTALFPFVESYYEEFVKGQKDQHHLDCVKAFDMIGDKRALPLLREIFQNVERKDDTAQAIGNLILNRRIVEPRYPLDELIDSVQNLNVPVDERNAAWKQLLADPEIAMERAMKASSLRYELAEPQVKWSLSQSKRFRFLKPFGGTAARHLLIASDDCTLQQRYFIANLLQMFLPESSDAVKKIATDESVNRDRQLTAQLAIKLFEGK